MINVIGSLDSKLSTTLAPINAALTMPNTALHWYGKSPPKPRRKMAHINVTGGSSHEVLVTIKKLEAIADAANAAATGVHVPTTASAPEAAADSPPLVGIIMGSDSDLPCMRSAAEILEKFEVPYEITIVSAHRTPARMFTLSLIHI